MADHDLSYREGTWVIVKDTGRRGVVVRALPGLTEVRVPSDNDWPFPSYVRCHPTKLMRCTPPNQPQEPENEPAPF